MSNTADEPLKKVTLNLYAKDVEVLQAKHASGYSKVIRRVVRKYVRTISLAEEE